MASLSTPLQVDQELLSNFQNALTQKSTRFFQVQVKNEQILLISQQNATGSFENDYDKMCDFAKDNQASYFVVLMENNTWKLITYVPDGVPIKEKMLYASAKGTLKDKLGHNNVDQEAHATTKRELTYKYYKGEKEPIDARSNQEKEHQEVLKAEAQTREEMVQQVIKKEADNIGGYHSVSMPLDSSAKNALDRFKRGEINFVSLAITPDQAGICCSEAKQISIQSAASGLNCMEPRFYILSQPAKPNVFVYCCPTKSAPKLRMVYSTAKPSVISQLTQCGITMAGRKVEITEPEDITEELKDVSSSTNMKSTVVKAVNPGMTGRMQGSPNQQVGLPEGGGTVKAANLPTSEEGHSVYSLMRNENTATASTKKKIVIPPRGAW